MKTLKTFIKVTVQEIVVIIVPALVFDHTGTPYYIVNSILVQIQSVNLSKIDH